MGVGTFIEAVDGFFRLFFDTGAVLEAFSAGPPADLFPSELAFGFVFADVFFAGLPPITESVLSS